MTANREKRRAVSREAARVRRRAESEVFCDLTRLLPRPERVRPHLDKPSIIRLTISYLRTHTLLSECFGTWRTESGEKGQTQTPHTGVDRQTEDTGKNRQMEDRGIHVGESGDGGLMQERRGADLHLNILEGFFMMITTEGDMIYLSENVSQHMGLTQEELIGNNIYEFSHPCDHEDIRDNLCFTSGGRWRDRHRDFLVRMKSTVTNSGRITNLKSASWRVLRCQGCVKVCLSPSPFTCLLLTCQPLPLTHTVLHTHTFTSQHNMDMRFIYCDQRVSGLLGYCPEELLGHSVYELCHTMDTHRLAKSHMNLCSKGQSVSGLYRLLVKRGGYVWVESHSAVISSPRPSKTPSRPRQPLRVLSVTYILSGVEEPSLLLSLDQTLCGHVS